MATGATGGKPRAPRAVKAVPDKPDLPRTTFSFDTAEREDGQAAPFVVELEKKRYILGDAMDLSADDLLRAMTDSLSFLELLAPKDAAEEFMALVRKQPAWKVRDVADLYFKHYGLPALGEGAA